MVMNPTIEREIIEGLEQFADDLEAARELKELTQHTSRLGNRERWLEIVKQTGKCPFCPKHGGENRGHRAKRTSKPKSRIKRRQRPW